MYQIKKIINISLWCAEMHFFCVVLTPDKNTNLK